MGRPGSRPEFPVDSGSGRVRPLPLWVKLGRVKKIGPTSNSESNALNSNSFKQLLSRLLRGAYTDFSGATKEIL